MLICDRFCIIRVSCKPVKLFEVMNLCEADPSAARGWAALPPLDWLAFLTSDVLNVNSMFVFQDNN